MLKSRSMLQQIYHICWLIFFSLLCLGMLMHGVNLRSFFVGAFLFFGVYLLYKKGHAVIDSVSGTRIHIIAACILCVYTALLFVISREMIVIPFSDTATIWFSAADVAETGHVSTVIDEYSASAWATHTSNNDYLLIYPNSQFLVACLIPYCKILLHFGVDLRDYLGYSMAAVLNIVLIVASMAFIYLAAKKARGNTCALLTLITGVLFAPYYLHAFKLYSDTMSMPFISLAILLTVCGDSCDRPYKKYIYRFCSGIAVGLGILLKGSILVFAVAVCVYLFVRRRSVSDSIAQVAALLAGIILVNGLWSVCSKDLSWLDQAKADQYELPAVHWIMMASDGVGCYSQSDLEYSLSFDTFAERKSADTAEFIRRVRSHGFIPHLRFILNKLSSAFNDGLYFQINHLGLLRRTRIYRLLNTESAFFHYLLAYCTVFVWYFYSGFLVSAIQGIRRDNGAAFLFNICMFGVILFFSFWECRSRYLLNYTPMFLLSAAFALDSMAKSSAQSRQSKHIRTRKPGRSCSQDGRADDAETPRE